MVISGRAHLAFQREIAAIKNLLTAARTLIQSEKQLYLLDPKLVIKRRCFSTPSSPKISTSRPRDSASVFSKRTLAFVPVPDNISMETLDDLLEAIEDELALYFSKSESSSEMEMEIENKVKANMEAIRSNGPYVLALWSKEELGNTGWKTGKYINL